MFFQNSSKFLPDNMASHQKIIFFKYIFALTEKILSTPSFGGEVKPSVPSHRFAACKRSLMA